MDPKEQIARRLVALRVELGRRLEGRPEGYSQSEFCDLIRVSKTVYNPFEQPENKRIITLDVAGRIRERFGVPTDWIYYGNVPQMSDILLKIGSNPPALEESAQRRRVRRAG